MKNLITILILSFSWLLSYGQNQWDIQLTQSNIDCAANQVCYQLEVQNTMGADWTLGDQNYRLFFDGDLMTVSSVTSLLPNAYYSAANIDMNTKYAGQGQDAASPLNDIDDNLGFLDFSIVQTNKTTPSSAEQLNTTAFTLIAEICVDVDPVVLMDATGTNCLAFYHSRPSTAGSFTSQYTTITENDSANSTIATEGVNHDDLTSADGSDACLGQTCTTANQWDIQLTQSNIDCAANQVCYQLEVQNTMGADWALGDQNYRLFFDGDLMTVSSVTSLLPNAYYGAANIDMNTKYAGQDQDAASPLNDIDDNLGFLDFSIVQTNKTTPSSAEQLNTTAFTLIAEICVDVDPAVLMDTTGTNCLAFYHSRPSTAGSFTSQYTTITENDSANSTIATEGVNHDDLTSADGSDACLGQTCARDFGDLPEDILGIGNYLTSLANNGPSHRIITGLAIGSTIDGESDGQPSEDALGDGLDEDGLTIFASLNLYPGQIFRLPFSYTNTTGSTAHVESWIDWNGDGDFNDSNEMVADWDDGGGSLPDRMEVAIPATAQTGSLLGWRIRISHQDNMTPYGVQPNGEVEDYLIEIACPQVYLPIQITVIKN